MDPIRRQYERLPYPPVPWFALPRAAGRQRISLDYGRELGGQAPLAGGVRPRILVVGAGTLEGLVAAQANPRAEAVLALDLSAASLARLRWRARLARACGHPSARLRFVRADLMAWPGEGEFDLILASNVLHHMPDPAAALARLGGWLRPGGFLRLVTYPRASRVFMRLTRAYLERQGLSAASPRLRARARAAMRELALREPLSPLVACFYSHPETKTTAGLVDAFFNARENPLSPLEWQAACARAGLRLTAEDQADTSRSSFCTELFPETGGLSPWIRLEILDRLLELCANPVLWLERSADAPHPPAPYATPAPSRDGDGSLTAELRAHLQTADALLRPVGVPIREAVARLARLVGPRVTADGHGARLPGMSLGEYDLETLLR